MMSVELQAIILDLATNDLIAEADNRLPEVKPVTYNDLTSYLWHKGVDYCYRNDYDGHTHNLTDILADLDCYIDYAHEPDLLIDYGETEEKLTSTSEWFKFFMDFVPSHTRNTTISIYDPTDDYSYIDLTFWGKELHSVEINGYTKKRYRINFINISDD